MTTVVVTIPFPIFLVSLNSNFNNKEAKSSVVTFSKSFRFLDHKKLRNVFVNFLVRFLALKSPQTKFLTSVTVLFGDTLQKFLVFQSILSEIS